MSVVDQVLLAELGDDPGVNLDGDYVEPPSDPAAPVAAPLAAPSGAPADEEPTLNLSVTLTPAGIIVTGSGGRLAPGCERLEHDGVTIPRGAAGHDIAALAACLARVHAQFPAEQTAIVTADPATSFAEVAAAIAASRGTAAAPLFPRTLLSVGVR